VRAIFNTSVWLQAGQYLAPAAQIPAKQKSGCPRLVAANCQPGPQSEKRADISGQQLASGKGPPAARRQIAAFKLPPSLPSRATAPHPEVRLLLRGQFPEGFWTAPPRVYSGRRRFSAPAHSTREAQLVCGVSAGHYHF
jgi:hypothetical protein